MRLTTLDEASIQAIGHAFGYYDYGKETGMGAACSSPDKTALYICGFVRAMLAAGLLYTTSDLPGTVPIRAADEARRGKPE